MFEYQAEAITRKSFNFESKIFNGNDGDWVDYSSLKAESKPVYLQDDDYTAPVSYESAWECYGGLSEEESWAELYAELND